MYTRVSIPHPGPGAAVAGIYDPILIILPVDDIKTEPTRTVGDVVMTGDFELNTGAKGIGIYASPGSIEAGFEHSGDVDARGFTPSVAFDHPGDSDQINSFIEQYNNRGVIILRKECEGGRYKVFGRKCNPLYLTDEPTDNGESRKNRLTFAAARPDKYVPGVYTGAAPELAETAATPENEGA